MLSDSEDDGLHQITVNQHYAKAFQYRKEREELDKLKAKLGSDISESDLEDEETDSESAESEDEDGEELTPAVDAAILRTLARIKRKDPSIYESTKDIFEEEQERLATFTLPNKTKKNTSSKPITLRQVALQAELNPSRSPSPQPLTHVQEQVALRKETISAFHTGENDDEDDDLLVPREKTKDEQEREEEEYRAFLERQVGDDLKEIIVGEEGIVKAEEESSKKKKKKSGEVVSTKSKKQSSKEEEDQEFLMSYILNRGWIDKSKNHIPTYNEITSKKHKKRTSQSDSDNTNNQDLSNDSDSSFDSLIDHFESSYNHRFEEPNSSTIPSFPRTIPTLVRREDTKRKEARERRKKRKEEDLERKREEVRRLKALKMREIRRKLERVGMEGGLIGSMKRRKGDWVEEGEDEMEMDETLKELDLEGDWDPEKHDQQMAGIFGGHDGEDGEGDWEDAGQVDEDGKPIWEDDIDIGDIHVPDGDDDDVPVTSTKNDKKKKKKKKKKKDEKDDDLGVDVDAMDADVQALKQLDGEEEEWDGTEEMRKRKLDEYMEEVYNLDFNDMVGDLPTRFKYAPVAKQSYSLTPVEILLATDKELNEFMSIKRYAPYKNDARKWDSKRQQKLKELRATLEERSKTGGWLVPKGSTKEDDDGIDVRGKGKWGEGEEQVKVKKRKGKKERMKAKSAATTVAGVDVDGEGVDLENGNGHDRDQDDAPDAEAKESNSHGDYAEVQKSSKIKSKSKLEEKTKEKGKGYKRKREDAEANMMDSSVEVQEHYLQEKQQQEVGKEDEDENGKPRKKRRRKHKKTGENEE